MKTNNLKPAVLLFAIIVLALISYATMAFKYDKPLKKAPVTKRTAAINTDLASTRIKNIEFGFNKSALSNDYYARLDRAAKLMIDNNAAIKLSGHADSKGGYVYNWKLSQARAEAVKAYLVSKGADSSRIAATEFGFTKPIASNHTKAGRQKNRRVELSFVQ